jgi:signal transduction histidine kinase
MRYRINLLVMATTSLVLVAFLVPLAVLVRTDAANRAVNAAVLQAQTLASVINSTDPAALAALLAQTNADGGYQFTLFLPDGSQVGAPAPRTPAVARAAAGASLTANVPGGREILIAVAGRSDGTAVIRTFASDTDQRRGVGRAWLVLGALGLGLLLVSVVVADQLARAAVRPLVAIVGVAQRLAGGDLAARARPDGPPEARAVGVELNLLAERIGTLLVHERETAADLSHRLRTPLTALRVDVESLSDPAERERLIADVDHLVHTVDVVIRTAREPISERGVQLCDAAQVVADRVEFWSALADEEARTVEAVIGPGPMPVRLSHDSLATIVDALLGNVFAHTPEGTGFAVRLTASSTGGARLTVVDHGPGLPEFMVPGRGRSAGGSTGLGLDIARRAAGESGGSLSLGRAGGGGTVVIVDLGAAAALRRPRIGPMHALKNRRRNPPR